MYRAKTLYISLIVKKKNLYGKNPITNLTLIIFEKAYIFQNIGEKPYIKLKPYMANAV